MKKYIFIVLGLVIICSALSYFIFSTEEIKIKSVSRILQEEDEVQLRQNQYLDELEIEIQLNKKINEVKYFLIKNETTNEMLSCKVYDQLDSAYKIKIDNLYFNNIDYTVYGYKNNTEEIMFKKSMTIHLDDPFPLYVENFHTEERYVEGISYLDICLYMYNPLQAQVTNLVIKNDENNIVLSNDAITSEICEDELTYQLNFTVLIDELNGHNIVVTSFNANHLDIDYFINIENVKVNLANIFEEVLIEDIIAPTNINVESREFLISIVISKEYQQLPYGFKLLYNDDEIEVAIKEITYDDNNIIYDVSVPTFPNVTTIELEVVEILYHEKIIQANGPSCKINTKRAIGSCNLKTKSPQVMLETRHTFYLECDFLDERVTLYKIKGKFNGQSFIGGNIISVPKEEQLSFEFGIIECRDNIIELISSPIVPLENEAYCSFEIEEIIYFFNNQQNSLLINQSLWVIPEETVVQVKSFTSLQDSYDLKLEVPVINIEVLLSSTIYIESIILDINGVIKEISFSKHQQQITNRGTYLYECSLYQISKENEMTVNLVSVTINGQGTLKIIEGFDDSCLFTIK